MVDLSLMSTKAVVSGKTANDSLAASYPPAETFTLWRPDVTPRMRNRPSWSVDAPNSVPSTSNYCARDCHIYFRIDDPAAYPPRPSVGSVISAKSTCDVESGATAIVSLAGS